MDTKLTAGEKNPSGNLALTEAYADVPGTSFGFEVAADSSFLLVTIAAALEGTGFARARVLVDGAELGAAHYKSLPAGTHTVKMQAKCVSGTATLLSAGTGYSYLVTSP